MSDDESTYERTRLMNKYLYGSSPPPSSSDANLNQTSRINDDDDDGGGGGIDPDEIARTERVSTAAKNSNTTHGNFTMYANGGGGGSGDEQRYRSKSHDSRTGILRVKTKEIERGVSHGRRRARRRT